MREDTLLKEPLSILLSEKLVYDGDEGAKEMVYNGNRQAEDPSYERRKQSIPYIYISLQQYRIDSMIGNPPA